MTQQPHLKAADRLAAVLWNALFSAEESSAAGQLCNITDALYAIARELSRIADEYHVGNVARGWAPEDAAKPEPPTAP